METKFLNQYLIISTFKKLKESDTNMELLNSMIKKDYLKEKINSSNLNFYSYSDAMIGVLNEANKDKKQTLIDEILSTTDEYIINDIRKNPPLAEYIMIFLNYLYFDIYFGTEKITNPKKIKSFLRNEKMIEIIHFKNTINKSLGADSGITYKVNRITEIIQNFNYKSVDEFRKQVDKIVEYIDRILKNLISLEVIPITFIFKHIYLPYQALVYRVNGNKESREAENFNFLAHKTLLSLNSYNILYEFLSNFKIEESDFNYLKKLNITICDNCKVNNLADLALLMCKVVIEVSDDKLNEEEKQILYLFYKDIELLVWEYNNLIDYLL